jgi:hypothetical protein
MASRVIDTALRTADAKKSAMEHPMEVLACDVQPLWQWDFVEVTGHNLETRGRTVVNRLLEDGWKLLHIYTLKYREDGIWCERPMAILGRPRQRPRNNGLVPGRSVLVRSVAKP